MEHLRTFMIKISDIKPRTFQKCPYLSHSLLVKVSVKHYFYFWMKKLEVLFCVEWKSYVLLCVDRSLLSLPSLWDQPLPAEWHDSALHSGQWHDMAWQEMAWHYRQVSNTTHRLAAWHTITCRSAIWQQHGIGWRHGIELDSGQWYDTAWHTGWQHDT